MREPPHIFGLVLAVFIALLIAAALASIGMMGFRIWEMMQ